MDIHQLLPKDKHDFDSVNMLKEYRLTADVRVELTQELIRLSNDPKPYDVDAEADVVAKELL